MALFALTATPLALVITHGRPHGIAHAAHSATIAGGVVKIAPHTITCRTRARVATCAADDAATLRAEADRLGLLAEKAALEAETLEIKAQMARPEGPVEAAPPAPAATADDEGPMVLSSLLRWIGPYPAVALSFPALSSPAQKARMLQAAGVGGQATRRPPASRPA